MSIGEQTRVTNVGAGSVSALPGLEPLYTASEVAGYLKLDETTVRRLFLDRPDVVKLGRAEARSKRSYVTLRIPLSAVQRFVRERTR
jgi:hypothetical protein